MQRRPPRTPPILFVLGIIAIALMAATLAVGTRPTIGTDGTLASSLDRGAPAAVQLPAVPPPVRTGLPLLVPTPSPEPTRTGRVRATRVVVRYLGIDLPIISRDRKVANQGPDQYPPCDVALYHTAFEQPGEPGTTYLYGHAREGMFLPLLEASMRDDGEELIGKVVRVYTSDDRLHLYRITKVKRHATDFSLVTDADPDAEQLILQTSEGPRGTVPKLQVLAIPYDVRDATREEARPEAKPRACYYTP
ncbi:MAG: sortase [Chloroflexota bacterium]